MGKVISNKENFTVFQSGNLDFKVPTLLRAMPFIANKIRSVKIVVYGT
jgi:hypothetical protein